MPISLSPNRTFNVSLAVDAELPADQRPAFRCRYLTADQLITLLESARAAEQAKTYQQTREILNAELGLHVVGLVNLEGDPKRLSGILTEAEMVELCWLIRDGSQLSEVDLKKSKSQSESAKEQSNAVPAVNLEPHTASA